MGGQRDIQLLVTPLAVYDSAHFDRLDIIARLSKLHRTPLPQFQHWAIEVGGERVFEITSRESEDRSPRLRICQHSHWWDERNQQSSNVRSRLIGWTTYPDATLDSRADSIWQTLFDKEYHLMSTNCQVFASVLWASSRVPLRDLKPEQEAQLQPLPTAMNPFLLIESKAKEIGRLALAQKKRGWFAWMFGTRAESEQKEPAGTPSADHSHDRIPHEPSKSWLDDLNEDATANDMNHKGDFNDMVRRVNERQSEKPQPVNGKAHAKTSASPERSSDFFAWLQKRFSWFRKRPAAARG